MFENDEKIKLPDLDFLSSLNLQQKNAVLNTEGPLLVLSGAGTGKTKVLTTRLANIIYTRKGGIKDILCVTFTNKAAFEMIMRVEKILKTPVEGMFIGTFHSIGARFLRRHASRINLKNDFTILDSEDQLRLLKQVINSIDLDTKLHLPKSYLYMIDQLKNRGLSHSEISYHEFVFKAIVATRNLVKRQLTWLNRFSGIERIIDFQAQEDLYEVAADLKVMLG